LRQVLSTTHSETLIAAVTDPTSILLLEPGANGTTARNVTKEVEEEIENGLNSAEVMLSKTRPHQIERMGLFD